MADAILNSFDDGHKLSERKGRIKNDPQNVDLVELGPQEETLVYLGPGWESGWDMSILRSVSSSYANMATSAKGGVGQKFGVHQLRDGIQRPGQGDVTKGALVDSKKDLETQLQRQPHSQDSDENEKKGTKQTEEVT